MTFIRRNNYEHKEFNNAREGVKIDKSKAKTAHDYISKLMASDNLTQGDKDELANIAIYINEETKI